MKEGQIISIEGLKGIYLETICISKIYSMISLFNLKTMEIEEWEEDLYSSIDWEIISQRLDLSESFIEEYQDKVDWYYILYSQILSDEFKEKWKHKLG